MKIILPHELESARKRPAAEGFRHFAHQASKATGSPWAFSLGVLVVLVWALSGPVFGFSEKWQLIINTGTTIVTFLMVFVIQNAQARDSKELHLKLDELIRAIESASNKLINCDDFSDDELEKLEMEIRESAEISNKL